MTATGDFLPADEGQEFDQALPEYPTAFGIQLTPKVQAIALTLVGVLGAFALYNFLVRPLAQEKDTLEGQVAEKEALVQQQEASLQEVAALQAQLDEALSQRVGIYSLLGDEESLDTLLLDINQQIQNSNASISDVLRANPAQLDNAQLVSLGLNRDQIQQVRTTFADEPQVPQLLFNSDLVQFNPNPPTQVTDLQPELAGKLESHTVNVSMQALFPQTLNILRNIERLEPLIVIRDLQQSPAPLPAGASADQLAGVAQPLQTSFTLDVLVPTNDPTVPPPPPAPPEAEGEATEGEAPAEAPAE
jgi:type IV pilus assembly protein PilO